MRTSNRGRGTRTSRRSTPGQKLTRSNVGLPNQIIIGMSHDSDSGKLPNRQLPFDINAPVDIRRVSFSARHQIPPTQLLLLAISRADETMLPRGDLRILQLFR